MKNVIIFLSSLSMFNSVFAGELLNRRTEESISFQYDETVKSIEVSSSRGDIPAYLQVENLSPKKSTSAEEWVDSHYNVDGGGALPAYTIFLPITIGYKIFDNIKNKKFQSDYKTLMKSINTDEVVKVSNDKFERIVEILKHGNRHYYAI